MESIVGQTNIPSLQEAKDYIYSIDFSMLLNKMIYQGWAPKHAYALCEEYRHFLFLIKKYGDLAPCEEIDLFWHNHILDTKKYREDCFKIFGDYLEHYPYFGIDQHSNLQDLTSAFENTQTIYKQEFNREMPKILNRFSNLGMWFRRKFKKYR